MENILKLYTISNDSANLLYDYESPVLFDSGAGIRLLDQLQAVPFPSESGQIEIYDFKYDAKRMGGAPTISATIMYERCLDKEWNPLVFAIFNGERYFIKQIPSSQYSNEDARYKHEIELVSERIVLDNVYFYDVVSKDVVNDKPVSNNSKFTFFGDIHEFASRLNYSLQYSKMDYTVVVDDGISSEGKFVSFEDTFFSNAIQESYNTYEIPYYFDGKTIHFGFTNNAITQTFKYGVDESLLSIQKQNANYKVVNRVTGTGSSDNIPYYYPNLNEWGIINVQVGWDKANAGYDWDFSQENELELKASDVVVVDEEKFATNLSPDDRVICYGYKWYRNILNGEEILLDDIGVKIINHDGNQGCPNAYFWFGQKRMGYAMPVQSNLMPPIYRSTEGEERFYNALNNTYISPETGTFYEFENQYADGKQKEQIVNFEDIKPSIVGMTNANGQRIDTFLEFAYDENDNDEIDEEGNYLHPYFFAKLPKYDGTYGFNLFDHALNEEEMTISMTSGSCGACEWTVMVDSETLKNTVQVDSDGNLLRDKNGNVSFGAAQDKQNDTINNEVWIALKKDIDTFGVIMPNVTNNYKPSAGDTFVILHILLPNSYIFAAENRLKEELIKYMAANNSEKFNFSIAFSRIYFAENPDVLGKLNENARIQIEYNGELHELYVSSFAYSMDSNSPLPNITVELSDTLAVQQNALQTAISQVEHSIMKNIGSIDWLKLGLAYFLRKDTDDRSRGKVASDKGFEVGKFVSGTSGAMIYLDKLANKTVAELDKIYVRVKAYFEQLEIVNVNSIGGKQIISPAGSIRCKAVETKEDIDYYRCYILAEQDGDKIENRFKVGDQAYCQMFNAKEGVENNISNRYYWRLVVGVGEDYIDLSKSDCDTNSDEPMANDIICQRGNRDDIDRQNFMEFSSVDSFSPSITLYQEVNDYSLVDKEVIQYGVDKTTGKGFMNIYGEMYVGDREETTYMRYTQENGLEIRGKLVTKGGDDVENYLTSVQDYMDGLIETYYGSYTPTNDNYPSIEWSTEEEKKQHINDVFINTEEFKDEETTPNAGLTWRWSCDENGVYGWQVIADKDIANSYKNAVLANKDAIAAKNSSDEVAKAGNEIKEITDMAFADGTVTESEKSQIDSKIVIITNLKSLLQSTYSALKDNELLAGIEKTNLTNGYSALVSAINELTSSITNVMADYSITDVERALISGKFEAFYSKQGDYNKYVLSALKAIQGTINAVSIRALDELGGYEYLKKALKESTVIKNGLIQSSVVALGYTDTEGKYHIMAGTNGLVDDVLTDKTPAIWAGGGMIDKEASEENASNPDAADFLVRMDGSGYAAGGKLSWDITGKVKADPLSFFVGENIVGALLASFQVVLKADKEHPDYIIPQVPFQKLQIADYIEIGDAWLKYDSTNNAVYVVHKDGSDKTINFYAEGGVSAKGFSDSAGGGGGGSTTLYGLNDVLKNATGDGVYGAAVGKVLMFNGTHWYAGDAKGKVVSIKVGDTNYAPNDDGLISLPEYAKVVNKTITADKFIGALQGNADTATKLKNSLTIQKNAVSVGAFDGSEAKVINIEVPTKVSELTNDSKYLIASNLIQGTNISIATDASTGNVTISNTYSYTHPTNGANTTIAAASGRVLSEITVNNLGHVTAVGYKTLAAADIPTLAISKISGLQSALDSKLNASVFNDLFEKVVLSDGITYAIRAKYGFYSDYFISAKGINSESGGSGGGGVSSIYVGSDQFKVDSEGIVRLPAYPTIPTSLKNPYTLTIKRNGTTLDSYDGSAAKEVNITVPTKVSELTNDSGFLTKHQTIYSLTIQGNGTALGTYTPNSEAKTINLTAASIGAAAASHTHNYLPLSGGTLGSTSVGNTAVYWASSGGKLCIVSDGTNGNFIESGNVDFSGNTTLSITGYYGNVGSSLYLKFANIYCREKGYVNLDSGNYNSYAPSLTGSGASGTWGINVSGYAGALYKAQYITDLNSPIWGVNDGYSINYNTCDAKVTNAPISLNNANLIMNIQHGKHSMDGMYGWQVAFFNLANAPYVRVWAAGSIGTWRKLLTSGNYNEFAPSLTGTGASGTWDISISGNAATASKLKNYYIDRPYNANISPDGSGGMCKFIATSTMTSNRPAVDGHILHFFWDTTAGWDAQLMIPNNGNSSYEPQWRGQNNGTWGSWISLVTSGTIGNYNAGTATKLQTARTIWGQSFNGTANISGAMSGVTSITANGSFSFYPVPSDTSNYYLTWGGSSAPFKMHNYGTITLETSTYIKMSANQSTMYIQLEADAGTNVNSPNAPALSLKRTTTDGGTFIRFFPFNQTSKYWMAGADWQYRFGIYYGGSTEVSFFDSSGNFATIGGVTAKASSSDIRLKTDISNFDALSIIRKHRSVKYHWNMVAKKNSVIFDDEYWHYGLIAQELQKDLPHFVKDVFNDYLTIDYERLTPIMWRGIQEVDDEVTKLKKKIMKLEMEINELKQERR